MGRLLIFVVAYNAEKHIIQTLERIPREWLEQIESEILIIDDASVDKTYRLIHEYQQLHESLNLRIQRNSTNRGYGGNQKIGYQYAIEQGFDHVVLLHGDGQYAPEYLPQMVAPLADGTADVVLGSRMLDKKSALQGKMPLYKWIGNQVLTSIQNMLLGTKFAEFHTGYRAYRVSGLRDIALSANSDYFDFDTEIIIQLLDLGARFREIGIPTFYGDEISYVNGLKYAWLILQTTAKSRMVQKGWVSDPRFDRGS